MITIGVKLTEEELIHLIRTHGQALSDHGFGKHIERINYLNKRLKSFSKEPSVGNSPTPSADPWI